MREEDKTVATKVKQERNAHVDECWWKLLDARKCLNLIGELNIVILNILSHKYLNTTIM